MPGKRLTDPSLVSTTFVEAVSNDAKLGTDWAGLANDNARPIPIKYLGNAWFQGSADNSTWTNSVLNTHDYLRVSTDGGTTWRVIDLTATDEDSHPALTIGSPDGGLSVSGDDTQILTLSAATSTSAGYFSATNYNKLDALKYDALTNLGTGAEIYKSAAVSGSTRTHSLKTLTSADGSVVFTEGTNSIDLAATGAGGGEANTALNIGTNGIGVFDNKNGVQLEFRNINSLHSGLTVALDAVDDDIDLDLVESAIDHDSLLNFATNEHIDHSTVSITPSEGITGGGTLAATRTLTLEFDGLGVKTSPGDTDVFAFYRNSGAEDLHYSITYSNLKSDLAIPTEANITGVNGISVSEGNPTNILGSTGSIGLDILGLSTIAYNSADYVAVYDVSNMNHARVTLSDIVGELAVSISAGNGLDFTTITSTGPVTLGTPTTLTETTTNAVTATSHTHAIDLSTFELIDIGDVAAAPTDGEYLKWNNATSTWVTDDPAIGATSPGAPTTSIQFNDGGAFGGSAGLTYVEAEDRIYLSAVTASDSGIIFGETTSNPTISAVGTTLQINSDTLLVGDPTDVADRYLQIKDPNSPSQLGSTIVVTDFSDTTTFKLDRSGQLSLPLMTSSIEDNILYFDDATGLITYGAAPSGTSGGISTVIADSLSGITLNDSTSTGDHTYSSSTIRVNQNDNRLTPATAGRLDYMGFWDVSEGVQSKMFIGNFPGWSLKVNGVFQDFITPSTSIDFSSGTGASFAYNDTTNTLTVNSGSSVLEDIAFEFADLTGDTQQYTLDLQASYGYTILNTILEADAAVSGTVSGGTATITFTSVSTLTENATSSVVTTGDRIYLNITTGHSATTIRGKLVIQRT